MPSHSRSQPAPSTSTSPAPITNNATETSQSESKRQKLLEELQNAKQELAELRLEKMELETVMSTLLDEDLNQKAEMERLKRELEEVKQRNGTLQMDAASQAGAFEIVKVELERELQNHMATCNTAQRKLESEQENVKSLQSQLQEAQVQLAKEQAEKENVLKEKDNMSAKFQEERVKRINEIIAVKTEKERMTQEQCKMMVFLRQLKNSSNFADVIEWDLLMAGRLLEDFGTHVINFINRRNEDELKFGRDVMKQLEKIVQDSRKFSPPDNENQGHEPMEIPLSSPQTSTTTLPVNSNLLSPSSFTSAQSSSFRFPTPEATPTKASTSTTTKSVPSPRTNQTTPSRGHIRITPSTPTTYKDVVVKKYADSEQSEDDTETVIMPLNRPIVASPQLQSTTSTSQPSKSTNTNPTLPQTLKPSKAPPSTPQTPKPSKALPSTPQTPKPSKTLPSSPQTRKSSKPTSFTPKRPKMEINSDNDDTETVIITTPRKSTTPSSFPRNNGAQNIVNVASPTGPSIVIKLPAASPTSVSLPPPVNSLSSVPLPPPVLSSLPTNSAVLTQNGNNRNVNAARRKQFTPFAVTNKTHGVNKASSKFSCECKNVYKNERSLKVHIRKMTKEWKYKCPMCGQYFFYQFELSNHKKAAKCASAGGNNANAVPNLTTPNGSTNNGPSPAANADRNNFNTDYALLEDLIGMPMARQQQQVRDRLSVPGPSRRPPPRPRTPGATRKAGLRKLQQEIIKRKKHAPWISNLGKVQGFWYCTCGSKFMRKSSMQLHVLYWSKEWKFKCEHCPEKFFYLSYLKVHMASSHKIAEPLKEFSAGCHLCGEKYRERKEYSEHRRNVHNYRRRTIGQRSNALVSALARSPSNSQARACTVPPPLASNSVPPSNLAATSSSTSNLPPSGAVPPSEEVIDLSSDDEVEAEDMFVRRSLATPSPPASSPSPHSTPQPPSSQSRRSRKKSYETRGSTSPRVSQSDTGCFKVCSSLGEQEIRSHIKSLEEDDCYRCSFCDEDFESFDEIKTHINKDHPENSVFKSFRCAMCLRTFNKPLDFEMHRFNAIREHQSMLRTSQKRLAT